LGHALAFCGTPIHPHPMLDVGQTPESVAVLMRQGVVWFNSMNTFWRTKRLVDRLTGGDYHRPAAWAMMLRLVHSNVHGTVPAAVPRRARLLGRDRTLVACGVRSRSVGGVRRPGGTHPAPIRSLGADMPQLRADPGIVAQKQARDRPHVRRGEDRLVHQPLRLVRLHSPTPHPGQGDHARKTERAGVDLVQDGS